jgi:hypothetical protein
MPRPVRIGNAHGFWGDRLDAAAELLAHEPDLDYITLDFLAEVSMSILALQRSRDPDAGWPKDFLAIIRSLVPYWTSGGRCRLITNAGGLNPLACARACQSLLAEENCRDRTIALVTGDDVLGLIGSDDPDSQLLRNLDTGDSPASIRDRLLTANAYLGAQPIAEALSRGADLVITGRTADPSLTVGPCVRHFAWSWDDWDRLAGATVAGHLIECGTQVTGGIATDWLDVPNVDAIGFPIAEIDQDGAVVITKPAGTGGRVSEATVKEQLLYEIGDPNAYLSPDVTLSFLDLEVEDEMCDRVRVRGARGRGASPTLKVSATYHDGFTAAGELTVFGVEAERKARRAAQAVFDRLNRAGVVFDETLVECVGAGACRRGVAAAEQSVTETVLRIAVADRSIAAVERFTRELMPLITAGPQGTTGYSAGRPRVHPLYRFWPCLIERRRVTPVVELLEPLGEHRAPAQFKAPPSQTGVVSASSSGPTDMGPYPRPHPTRTVDPTNARLRDIAYARSGDKATSANIGVVARQSNDFDRLCRILTVERVARFLGVDDRHVSRFELPKLSALNFVIRRILSSPLRLDAQGKALGQVLLEMPIEI